MVVEAAVVVEGEAGAAVPLWPSRPERRNPYSDWNQYRLAQPEICRLGCRCEWRLFGTAR